MTKKVIGFGGTYYTGWQISEETRNDGNVTFVHTTCVYCQNLSKDPTEARKKWGTDEINMDLRGTRTFSFDKKIVPEGCFRCGMYEGHEYSAADENYLAWYYGNAANEDEKPLIEERLINAYSWTRMGDGRCLSPEDVEAEIEWMNTCNKREALINGSEPIKVTFDSNLDDYGEYCIRDLALGIKFKEFKEMYYNGWPYGLPMDSKGKAKRIKNKTIEITSWKVLSEACIEVIDCKFVA